MITGGVSVTTTSKGGHDAILLALSVAEQVTVVVPRPNELPGAREQPEDFSPELSDAEYTQLPTAVGLKPFVGDSLNGEDWVNDGHVNTGGAVSTLVIENEQIETLPALSVAMHPM